MRPHRYAAALRAVAAAAALTVATAGGGLPMCASLLAQTAAPCAMHTEHLGSAANTSSGPALSAPSGHATCHADASSAGCAAGGVCPAGGTAAPIADAAPLGLGGLALRTGLQAIAAHRSFVAPPFPPPPQA